MSNVFICQLCKKICYSHEELITHLTKEHTKLEEGDNEEANKIQTIAQAIKNKYPKVEIDIKDGKNHYCKYRLNIKFPSGLIIEQRVGNTKADIWRINSYPETTEEVINNIEKKLCMIDSIAKEIKELGTFNMFKCIKLQEGYYDIEAYCTFLFKVNENDDVKQIDYYYKTVSNLDFMNNFKHYFTNKIEGEIKQRVINGGYDITYEIDGVDIIELLKKGKRVRIEVLE